MNLLTPEILQTYLIYRRWRSVDYRIVQQGEKLQQQGGARVTEFTSIRAVCEVDDDRECYTVTIQSLANNDVDLQCTCEKGKRNQPCVHVVAAMHATRVHIQTVVQNHWRYRLQRKLDSAAPVAYTRHPTPYIVAFGLSQQKSGHSDYWSAALYKANLQSFPEFRGNVDTPTPEEISAWLDRDTTWMQQLTSVYNEIDPEGCVNLPRGEAIVLSIMHDKLRFRGYGSSEFVSYFPWLMTWRIPVVLLTQTGLIRKRLEILNEPVTIEAALDREVGALVLRAGLRLQERLFTTLTDDVVHILSTQPLWIQADRYLARVANPEALPVMELAPLKIPSGEEEEFRSDFVPQLVKRVALQGKVVTWEEIQEAPVPRLYLADADDTLVAALRFGYGEHEMPAEQRPAEITIQTSTDSWSFLRIHRQVGREATWYQMLTDAVYGLKRMGRESPYGTFGLRARTHPYDFLVKCIPALTAAGFEIYGEEKLKMGRVNRATPSLSLGVSSGLDWFDLTAAVRYGDQEVSLRDVRGALRKGQRYVKLADGSIGELPQTWLERYRRLFDMAEETADGHYRLAEFHLPLLDSLLETTTQVETDADFIERRQRLRDFKRIVPQPIPDGFVGELRPYQKMGVDWLHFLHTYDLGGCLADDMGLGKTIQVLALLQSLREQGKRASASLLVVPKSLLVNWQREAAHFTPELRILDYTGNARNKDRSRFDEVDLVLTTYGVMLRDIEFLHERRFDYAILDESQAIKNPLSKSAKAARLLNAAHRLVLTGTPVENNTFELWSQFAYLNPGLLGNLEYFKREFAGPIEREQDEDAAKVLRQLIYPFILRRTKEEVAPELPAFTERVLYVDMEPAQRRVYQRTREYYRRLLLGMIEDQGLDDARMKILEGLLRLRQASIHPALLEPTYRGEAPKFELLLETLETLQSEGHKALIFSQFVEVLSLLRKELDARKTRYAYLDGKTRKRQEQVDAFQNDPSIPFFLISLKAGGVGLNLTAADYVIHLDPWWNPAVEQQASDRAHRIGQDKPVFVYKLITRDSVEEKILVLQERKLQLVDQLISSEGGLMKSLTVEDVKALFG